MDLLDLLKVMLRLWYVCVPMVALTLGGAFTLGEAIQPEYKTSAAVLLVPATVTAAPPAPEATARPGNPWLRVGENAMAQAVAISLSAHGARTRVAAAGGDPGYQIGLVNRSSILTVEVTAASRAGALATVVAVTDLIRDEVASQQARYPSRPGEQISTEVLDPGHNITQSRSNVLRAQLVVGAIGLLLSAAAAVVWDAVARHRAAARSPGGLIPEQLAPGADAGTTATATAIQTGPATPTQAGQPPTVPTRQPSDRPAG